MLRNTLIIFAALLMFSGTGLGDTSTTKPVAAKPVAAKPVAAKPVAAKPVAAKPVAAKPVAAKPVVAKPVVAKPVAAKPVAAKPVAAPAAKTPATQTWWQALLVPVMSVVSLFLVGFLIGGLRKLIELMEDKWHIQVPKEVEALLLSKATWAVHWAEEQAENRLLHGDGKKTPGADKLSKVVDLVEEYADKLGYGDDWQKEKVTTLVEGILHVHRDAPEKEHRTSVIKEKPAKDTD